MITFIHHQQVRKFEVSREATAWNLIGWDDGLIRIKGGRTYYEAVMYNCENDGSKVKLCKLVAVPGMKFKEVKRYVDPETIIEVLKEVPEKPHIPNPKLGIQ